MLRSVFSVLQNNVCSVLQKVWGWEYAYSCADLGWGFAPWVSGFTNCVLFLILVCKQS